MVSDCKTISALHRAKPRLSCETKVKTLCVNNEATTAPLTLSTLLSSAKEALSFEVKATKAPLGAGNEVTLYRVQPRLSHEIKTKAPLCANSVADSSRSRLQH